MKKEKESHKLLLYGGIIVIVGLFLFFINSDITGKASKQVNWKTFMNGDLRVSEPYRQYQFLITEVELSPNLVTQIKNNKLQADVAGLIADVATFDYEGVQKLYMQDWDHFDISKKIKNLKKADVVTEILSQATSYFADKVAQNCLTQIAMKKPADKDGKTRFKIKTRVDARQNSYLYPDWAYIYVVHDWDGYCTQESKCQGSINVKTGEESTSCFG